MSIFGGSCAPEHTASRLVAASSELVSTLGDCFQPGKSLPTRFILAASSRAPATVGPEVEVAIAGLAIATEMVRASAEAAVATKLIALNLGTSSARRARSSASSGILHAFARTRI